MSNYSDAVNREAAAAAAAARLRARQDRLRQLVRDLELSPPDTAPIEDRLAAATVAQQRIDRHRETSRAALDALGDRLHAQAAGAAAMFESARNDARQIQAEMDARAAELGASIAALHRERKQQADRARAALEAEAAVDAARERDAAARRDQLVRSAADIVRAMPEADIMRAGLTGEVESMRARLDAVAAMPGEEGLMAARRVADDADVLAGETRWRAARANATQKALDADIVRLRDLLVFSGEQRRVLVGTEPGGLDAPLRQELDRLAAALRDRPLVYESLEFRAAELTAAIERVAAEVERLRSDVERFEDLNAIRFALIDERLPRMLEEVAGAPVQKTGETLPDLALKPVDVHFRVPRTGEVIDCTVALDGSLRVHHHQHATLRDCMASAERLAEVLPRTMEMARPPRMDSAEPPPAPDVPYVVRPLVEKRS